MKPDYLAVIFSLSLCVPAQAATLAVSVKDSGGKPLAHTVVYIDRSDLAPEPQAGEISIEQKGKEFNPFVSVTPVGTTAYFPNRDGIGHHVYSFSPARTFEMPLSEAETSESVLFDKAGLITVGCNIHDWMVAYIYIVTTPYHAVTDTSGQLTIDNLPPGNHTIHVWHPGIKTGVAIEQPLLVRDGESMQQDFTLEIKPEYFWKPVRPPETEEEQY